MGGYVEMEPKEIGCDVVYWILLARDEVQWRTREHHNENHVP
jgi:hypothetical protein